jgi:putative transposase
MPNSYNRIWIHAIWATKLRKPFLQPDFEKQVFGYMRDQFVSSGCPVRIINGMPDHVHFLFLMNPKNSLTSIINSNYALANEEMSWIYALVGLTPK